MPVGCRLRVVDCWGPWDYRPTTGESDDSILASKAGHILIHSTNIAKDILYRTNVAKKIIHSINKGKP